MKAVTRISGAGGSDILAAGTYKRSDDTLKSEIYAFEYVSAAISLTAVKNQDGKSLMAKLDYLVDSTAITQDMGLMVFPDAVTEFISDAVIKVWYV